MPIRWISLLAVTACLALGQSKSALPQDPARRSNGSRVLAEFPVFTDGDALLLPVRIGDKDYAFLLDTGATSSVFDTSLPLGAPIETGEFAAPSGAGRVTFFRAPKASLGKLAFRDGQKVGGIDLAKIRQIGGHPIYGMIGMDFLTDHVVHLDFDRGLVRFLEAVPEAAGPALPLIFREEKLPCVAVETLGLNLDMMVDTGFVCLDSGWVDRSLFELAVQLQKLKVVGSTLSSDLSATVAKRIAKASHLRAGQMKLDHACFSEAEGSVLTLGFLSRFNVTFDFPNKTMYLAKNKNFDRPDTWDRSGLHLLRDGDKTLVHSADKKSPAEQAGITAGDEIVKVADREAAELRLFEIRRRLATPAEALPLVIRRDGKQYQTALKLAD